MLVEHPELRIRKNKIASTYMTLFIHDNIRAVHFTVDRKANHLLSALFTALRHRNIRSVTFEKDSVVPYASISPFIFCLRRLRTVELVKIPRYDDGPVDRIVPGPHEKFLVEPWTLISRRTVEQHVGITTHNKLVDSTIIYGLRPGKSAPIGKCLPEHATPHIAETTGKIGLCLTLERTKMNKSHETFHNTPVEVIAAPQAPVMPIQCLISPTSQYQPRSVALFNSNPIVSQPAVDDLLRPLFVRIPTHVALDGLRVTEYNLSRSSAMAYMCSRSLIKFQSSSC
jgi:hypothetical protein